MKLSYFIFPIMLMAAQAHADNSTLDAAIGGAIGGAAGAAVGNEIGGREGAIVGGALGAALGTAANTKGETSHPHTPPPVEVEYGYAPRRDGRPQQYHCPPGQRKKGNC